MVNYAYLYSRKAPCIFAPCQVELMPKHTDYHCLIQAL
nr:MAG TPA: hypothetical protein [Caudoviricetes sp.]DAN49071.1 MAG TPA: hypothetical protein [Caudoviricetes sp.]